MTKIDQNELWIQTNVTKKESWTLGKNIRNIAGSIGMMFLTMGWTGVMQGCDTDHPKPRTDEPKDTPSEVQKMTLDQWKTQNNIKDKKSPWWEFTLKANVKAWDKEYYIAPEIELNTSAIKKMIQKVMDRTKLPASDFNLFVLFDGISSDWSTWEWRKMSIDEVQRTVWDVILASTLESNGWTNDLTNGKYRPGASIYVRASIALTGEASERLKKAGTMTVQNQEEYRESIVINITL